MATILNQLINRGDRDRAAVPVAAGAVIPTGTLFFITSAGYATNVATGNKLGGVAIRGVDNASGSNGDKTVEGWREGQFVLPGTGFAQTSVGEKVYAVDNYALTTTAGSNIYAGKVTKYVSATEVKFDLDVLADA